MRLAVQRLRNLAAGQFYLSDLNDSLSSFGTKVHSKYVRYNLIC